jgi:glutamate/tyrosine decarboxylase-like PLP-dependent enzyme
VQSYGVCSGGWTQGHKIADEGGLAREVDHEHTLPGGGWRRSADAQERVKLSAYHARMADELASGTQDTQTGAMIVASDAAFADLLRQAAGLASDYRSTLRRRPVRAPQSTDDVAAHLGGDLRSQPTAAGEVIAELAAAAEGGLTATAGPRFFGFVIGGSLPAATAADVLAAGWDQCAFNAVLSPSAAAAEAVAGRWLKQLLALPSSASVGFVTGAQAANTAGLAAGRHKVLADVGWDVEQKGLQGAPRIRVVASVERHSTLDRSLRLLGLGNNSVVPVAADQNGAIDVADLATILDRHARERAESPHAEAPPIVALQVGNVNTGACDDLRAAIAIARDHGAWVHVDGAFGLWAAASRRTRHLVDGVELADSWGCDGHKWLNVPYDSGFVFCAYPDVATTSMSYTAPYLTGSGIVTGMGDLTAESSRRARGFAAWAALRELGVEGVESMIDRGCGLAKRFAAGLEEGGASIVNDVVLNQVLVDVGDEPEGRTDRIVEAIQADGTCWLGATTWRGKRYLRISVSNYATSESDIDVSVAAILRIMRSI